MATPETSDSTASPAAYDTFDDYLRLAIKEYYDRGWSSRRSTFVALVIASGQTMAMAKDVVTGEKGLKNIALGAVGVVALRLGLRFLVGGPLGILFTAASAASLVAYFVRNQKEISGKVGRMRELVADERKKFEDVQNGYRQNRYDARERNLMIDGQIKRFLQELDEQ